MKRRASAAVQNTMAGCLTSVVILALLVGLATAAIETRWSKQGAKKASASVIPTLSQSARKSGAASGEDRTSSLKPNDGLNGAPSGKN